MIAKSATGDVDLGQPIPAAKVPEWLRVRGDERQTARFEVTLRRPRKAPRKAGKK